MLTGICYKVSWSMNKSYSMPHKRALNISRSVSIGGMHRCASHSGGAVPKFIVNRGSFIPWSKSRSRVSSKAGSKSRSRSRMRY
jgi:hypothetical protein